MMDDIEAVTKNVTHLIFDEAFNVYVLLDAV
jgi:hypothetical protein